MDRLLTRTPGLKQTHRIYSRFTRDERRRECALAREKAIRDEADHLEFALEKGEQIGLEKGRAEGRIEAVTMLLKSKFPAEFTDAECEKIQKITDLVRLDELMQRAISATSYSEIVSFF